MWVRAKPRKEEGTSAGAPQGLCLRNEKQVWLELGELLNQACQEHSVHGTPSWQQRSQCKGVCVERGTPPTQRGSWAAGSTLTQGAGLGALPGWQAPG